MMTLRLLRSLNVDLNSDRLPNGATFLHEAVINKHSETAFMLLRLSANPNKRCNKKLTPLHITISNESIKIIKILLDFGANFNQKYKGKFTITVSHRG